ncbi:LuxR C-terminal-related transcriptional regulator [Actinoplanes sp. NPDC051475]|uniref:LuxR C-terminal-related transcriptional regulator n=1 Tax=Actinoplanes sp. NPDC051475 TaxID=3157225 RepID=UPI00344E769B
MQPYSVLVNLANEILAHGIMAVLETLPIVGRFDRSRAGSPPAEASFDVVITTVEDMDCVEWPPPDQAPTPKILLLIDEDAGDWPDQPADGYLPRRDLTRALLNRALEQFRFDEVHPPGRLGRSLLTPSPVPIADRQRPPTVRLTAREQQTLQLLSEGCSNKQIATRLNISVHGAKRLVGNVLLKLAVENRTAAVVSAMRWGLLPSAS